MPCLDGEQGKQHLLLLSHCLSDFVCQEEGESQTRRRRMSALHQPPRPRRPAGPSLPLSSLWNKSSASEGDVFTMQTALEAVNLWSLTCRVYRDETVAQRETETFN